MMLSSFAAVFMILVTTGKQLNCLVITQDDAT
jgi:hypothetical protein